MESACARATSSGRLISIHYIKMTVVKEQKRPGFTGLLLSHDYAFLLGHLTK